MDVWCDLSRGFVQIPPFLLPLLLPAAYVISRAREKDGERNKAKTDTETERRTDGQTVTPIAHAIPSFDPPVCSPA